MRLLIFKSKPLLPLAARALRWHLSYFLAGKARPISGGIYVTNRCNLQCSMCTYSSLSKAETVPFETFSRYVDALAKGPCYYFSISGGEPLMVEDIVERVAYASARIPYTHLVTNGWFMTPELAAALEKAGLSEISISIDGSEEFHDRIRRKKGSCRRAWEALHIVRRWAPGIVAGVNSLVGPENTQDIRKIVLRLEAEKISYKVAPFCKSPPIEGQREQELYPALSADEMAKVRALITFLKKQKNVINSRAYLSKIPEYYEGKPLLSGRSPCLNPYFYVEMMWDSRIYPCFIGMGGKNGIDSGGDLDLLFLSKKYRQIQCSLENCRACDHNLPICYWEPRVTFPISNFIRFTLLGLS